MKKVDYSSDAITRRLKQTDQLRVVSLALIQAKKEQDEKAVISQPQPKFHRNHSMKKTP